MSRTVLTSLLGQKSWANRELFDLLATLPADEHAEGHRGARSLARNGGISLYRWRCRSHDAGGNARARDHPRGLPPGQCGQMLKGIAVVPPRDLFTKYLHQKEPARRQR